MVTTIADLAAEAVRTRSPAAVLGTFVAAARRCAEEEARGDVRDGLIDMPLPFHAAWLLELDADVVVADALGLLVGRSAELLQTFAGRPDRADIGAMGWTAIGDGDAFAYRGGP